MSKLVIDESVDTPEPDSSDSTTETNSTNNFDSDNAQGFGNASSSVSEESRESLDFKTSRDSYKTFSDIESDFKFVDTLPTANPKNFQWDLLSRVCSDVNRDDFMGPNGCCEMLSLLVLQTKISKELKIRVPDNIILEFLNTKWKLTEQGKKEAEKPKPFVKKPFKPYTVSEEIKQMAKELSRVKVEHPKPPPPKPTPKPPVQQPSNSVQTTANSESYTECGFHYLYNNN